MAVDSRSDSWQNLLTGLGSARDKVSHTQFHGGAGSLSAETLEGLFIEDDIAARVCELPPNEMLRQGFSISIGDDKEAQQAINELLRELSFAKKLMDALIWARVFGGAALFLGIDDGQDPQLPVREASIKNLRFVSVLNSSELHPLALYSDPLSGKFGEPEIYQIHSTGLRPGASTHIHESRLLVFHGSRTPKRAQMRNHGWSLSVLQRLYPVMQQFNASWQATSHLMTDAAQAVFKLKGLHSAIAANRTEDLLKRMELVDMSRSVSRSILLDADDEEFSRDSYNLGGIHEILDKFMLRLAAAARMPVSLLMGQAPAGLGATGDSDIRFFYDQIRAAQEDLKPQISRFVRLLTLAKEGPTKGAELSFKVEFPSLWQSTAKEQAELEVMHADADCRYIQEGVLLPEEVARRRFGDLAFAANHEVEDIDG